MSSNKFRVWLNHEYLSEHPEYSWIKEVYSKAVTQAVNNGQTAFARFFNHESACLLYASASGDGSEATIHQLMEFVKKNRVEQVILPGNHEKVAKELQSAGVKRVVAVSYTHLEKGGETFRVDALVAQAEASADFELAPVFLRVPAVWMHVRNQGTAYTIKGQYGYGQP